MSRNSQIDHIFLVFFLQRNTLLLSFRETLKFLPGICYVGRWGISIFSFCRTCFKWFKSRQKYFPRILFQTIYIFAIWTAFKSKIKKHTIIIRKQGYPALSTWFGTYGAIAYMRLEPNTMGFNGSVLINAPSKWLRFRAKLSVYSGEL